MCLFNGTHSTYTNDEANLISHKISYLPTHCVLHKCNTQCFAHSIHSVMVRVYCVPRLCDHQQCNEHQLTWCISRVKEATNVIRPTDRHTLVDTVDTRRVLLVSTYLGYPT
jgi:hypothetical protein